MSKFKTGDRVIYQIDFRIYSGVVTAVRSHINGSPLYVDEYKVLFDIFPEIPGGIGMGHTPLRNKLDDEIWMMEYIIRLDVEYYRGEKINSIVNE